MPEGPVAVLDACILFQGRLTNLLLWLAEQGAFEPIWSDEIHAEWMRNLAASTLHIPKSKIDWRKAEMERAFPVANCAPSPSLTVAVQAMCRTEAQRKDAHVVATAVAARASIIVTHNINDFAPAVLQHYRIAKMRPDAFSVALLGSRPAQVLAGLREHRCSLKRTPMDPEQYLSWLAGPNLELPRLSRQLQIQLEAI